MKKLKKYVGFFAAAVVFACLIMLLSNLQLLEQNPFNSTRILESPAYASYSDSGKTVVVEKNKTCVTVLDKDMKIVSAINGGDRKNDSFYYAEFASICNDIVYVVDVQHTESGSKVKTERIQKFSLDGEYLGTLKEYTYEDDNLPRYYGKISSLSVKDGVVFYTYNDGLGISLYEISDAEPQLLRTLTGVENDDISHAASYNPETDKITFTTKKGAVYTEANGKKVRADKADNVSVLWEAVIDNEGSIFVTDIKDGTLIRLSDKKAILDADSSEIGGIYYRLSFSGGKLASTNNSEIFLIDSDGTVNFKSDTVENSDSYRTRIILTWVCAVIIAIALLFMVIYLIIIISKSGQKKSSKLALVAGLIVIITSLAVSSFIISTYQERLDAKAIDAVTQTCKSISTTSGETFGDAFERINELDDYKNADFTAAKQYLDTFCESYYDSGSNAYYLAYKPKADGILYAVLEYENSIGTVYPAYLFEGSGYDEAYNTGETISVPGDADAYGKWSFAAAPIYNSKQEIIGVLEVGTNTYNDELKNKETIKQIIVTTFVAIAICLLLFTEIASISDSVSKYKLQKRKGIKDTVLEFTRPLTLLIFMADGLDGAFLPQLSERLFRDSSIDFLQEGFAAALPMSLQLLAVALSAIVCGFLIDKFRIKNVMLVGACTQMAALGLSALAVSMNSFWLFALLKMLGGFGMGACIVSNNAMPLCEKDGEARSKLFTGNNVGMMSGIVLGASIGSYVAQHIGYIYIYIAAAALILCGVVMICVLINKNTDPSKGKTDGEAKQKAKASDIMKYIFKPRVLAFFICAMLPLMIMLYFKEFMFPLFADSTGKSESDIGNIILFCGMISIWLGDVLTEQLNKKMGAKRCVIFASLLYIAALALFGMFESYVVAVLAVIIICVASSFGLSSNMMYYSELSSAYKVNEGTSMGIYSLFDNLGQTLGAPIFGALLVFGFGGATYAVAGVAAALILLFALISMKRKGETV